MRLNRPAIVVSAAIAGLAFGITDASADVPVPWTVTNHTQDTTPTAQPWTTTNHTDQVVPSGSGPDAPSTPSTPSTDAAPAPEHVSTHHHHSASASTNTWFVQPGDTLSEISAVTGVSVRTLAKRNGIDNPDLIFAGSTLTIH